MELFNELDCRVHGKDRLPVAGGIQLRAGSAAYLQICSRSRLRSNPRLLDPVPERMGTYCEGCPHRASFLSIETAVDLDEVAIGGDIGCSSLPPHKPDWLMCMNAGVGVSQGISAAIGG